MAKEPLRPNRHAEEFDDDIITPKINKSKKDLKELSSIATELSKTFKSINTNSSEFLNNIFDTKDIQQDILDSLKKSQENYSKLSKDSVATKQNIMNLSKSFVSIASNLKTMQMNNADLLSDNYEIVDVENQLLELKQIEKSLQGNTQKSAEKIVSNLIKQVDVQKKLLASIKDRQEAETYIRDIGTEIKDSTMTAFDKIQDRIESLPLGKAFSKSLKLDVLKEKISKTFASGMMDMVSGKPGASFAKMAKDIASEFTGVFAGIDAALIATIGIVIAVVALFVLAIGKLHQMEAAAEGVRKETGLMKSQTSDLEETLVNVNMQYSSMGVTIEVAAEAATALAKEMGNVAGMTKEAISVVSVLNQNYAVGADDAAKVYKKLFDFTGGNVKQINGLIGETISLSNNLGISFSSVMSDVASSGEEIHTYFNGDANAIMRAAINARRLGINLKTVTSMAESLLDFDASLEKELHASAVLGKSIDFSAARYSFATGEIEKGTEQIYEQINALGDFNKLNFVQKKATAEAAGMTVEELGTMMNQKKVLASMTDEQRAKYEIGLKDLESMKNNIDLQKESLIREQQMQSTTSKISHMWDGIVSLLAGTLLPLLEILNPILLGLLWAIKMPLDLINVALQAVYGVIKWIGGLMGMFKGNAFEGLNSSVSALGGDFSYITNPSGMAEGGIVTKPTMSMIGEGGSAEAVIPLDTAGIKTQSDPTMLKLLEEILNAIKMGGDVLLDGRKVGSRLAMAVNTPV